MDCRKKIEKKIAAAHNGTEEMLKQATVEIRDESEVPEVNMDTHDRIELKREMNIDEMNKMSSIGEADNQINLNKQSIVISNGNNLEVLIGGNEKAHDRDVFTQLSKNSQQILLDKLKSIKEECDSHKKIIRDKLHEIHIEREKLKKIIAKSVRNTQRNLSYANKFKVENRDIMKKLIANARDRVEHPMKEKIQELKNERAIILEIIAKSDVRFENILKSKMKTLKEDHETITQLIAKSEKRSKQLQRENKYSNANDAIKASMTNDKEIKLIVENIINDLMILII